MSFFKALTIPEGSVQKLVSEDEVLWSGKSYTLTLTGIKNAPFELVTDGSVPNPDPSRFDGPYRSDSVGRNNTTAAMRIDFEGYPEFVIYIRSWANDTSNYIFAESLDYPTCTYNGRIYDTSGNQQSGTDLGSYTKCTYPNDGGHHWIYIGYRHTTAASINDDRGYVLIEK